MSKSREGRPPRVQRGTGWLKRGLGFDGRRVFHSIRKTVVTLLENAGVQEGVAADIVGHKKQTITFGLYSEGNKASVMAEAIERIEYPL